MAMNENSKNILKYLKSVQGKEHVTSADIASALGLAKKNTVDGAVTAMSNKKLAKRIAAKVEVTGENGAPEIKEVKFIELTDAGMAFDPDAVTETAVTEDA